MSLTFPDARAIATTSAALASGAYALSMVLLAAGATTAALIAPVPSGASGQLLLGFALAAAAGNLLRWWTSSPRAALAVASAAALTGVWTAATAVTALVPASTLNSSSYFFSDLTIAVVFLGTLVWRGGRAPLAVTVAAAATQAIVVLTVTAAGGQPRLDRPAVVVWAIVTGVLLGLERRRRRSRAAAIDFARAEQGAREAASTRSSALGRAALLHDTVLSDLAALSALPPGPLPPRARARLLETTAILRNGAAACPLAETPATATSAITEILARRPRGAVVVQVSGDTYELGRLEPAVAEALLLAVTQCLANIDRHSRARSAELYIGTDATHLTVMLSDDGIGFDPSSVPTDKLGLRTSVHGRIEAVGGRVDIWSSDGGSGTTVVLAVPLDDVSEDSEQAR